MLAQHGSMAHRLLSFLATVVAIAILLVMAPRALAQAPDASQPAARNLFLPAPQGARLPPTHGTATRPQTHLAVPAMDSLPPSFSTGAYSTGGHRAGSVTVADLNGDGMPDLVVPNYCASSFCDRGSVAVFVGTGGGGYRGPYTYDAGGSGAYLLSVADVNHDGKLDVVVANTCYYGNYWPLCSTGVQLLGNGDGTLQAAQPYPGPVGNTSGSSALVDFNGDGVPDLVGVSGSSVYVWLGNADGTYQPAVLYDSGGDNAMTFAVADVNGDGYSDILAVNECADAGTCSYYGGTGSIGVLIGNGDGTFQPTVSFSTGGAGAGAITVADADGDYKPDLLVTNACDNQGMCSHSGSTVGVLINTASYTGTAATMVASVNPSSVDQAVTFTATVKTIAGTLPDGEMITFKNGVTILGTVPLRAGTASLTTSALPVGTLNITAKYAYDGTYGASVAQVSQVVKAVRGYGTVLSLSASPNPASVYQAVTVTAALTSSHGTIPDGQVVTFYDHAAVVATAPIIGGVATFVTSSLTAKTHPIKALYPGDATFKSSSRTVQEVVNGFQPYITFWDSSPNPSTYGQPVSLHVTVFPSFPPQLNVTGTVKFVWDRFTIGSATLSSAYFGSEAFFTTSTLNAGSFPLRAVYSGDDENAGATSGILNQVVLQTTSAATLTSSANPSALGQAVTFTAKITSPTVTAKGPVTFAAGNTVLGTAQLSWGKAKLTTSSLPAGTTTVTVTYEGDSNIARSTASVAQVVQ
ncbi:MAG TPA: Ig-like domain repeat protein [Candidatus Dormibacteraeota bacterium]|nr:Ig-like domain repeat protein [Candidatus Dormibacteraeota bacterium]